MFRNLLLLVFILISWFETNGQIHVRGEFHADTIKIGQKIPYSLTARYPRELNVLFPDTTFSFAPFEFESKKYFKTLTRDSLSYDSVVYFLSTYEIDSVQSLKVPVFVVHPSDCTTIFSNSDFIVLQHLVAHVPDSVSTQELPLLSNTGYFSVHFLTNYPLLMIIGGVLLLILVAVWIFYGGRIRKYFLIRRLNKDYASFVMRFNDAIQQFQNGFTAVNAETALVIWKQYMETLENKPFTKFTSREILAGEVNETLATTLHHVDRVVYGGVGSDSQQIFSGLQEYSQHQFSKRLEALRHG